MNGKKKFRGPSNLMNLPKSYKRARYSNTFFIQFSNKLSGNVQYKKRTHLNKNCQIKLFFFLAC